MLERKDHQRSVHNVVDSTDKVIKCSCGADWVISHIEWATGDDKFDRHVKEVTGKYPKEHK